jgi:hypothetical protein
MRLRTRYGIFATHRDYTYLCQRIHQDLHEDRLLTYPAQGNRLFVHVPWRGQILRVIWCPITRLIITAHHPEARWHQRRRKGPR